MKKEVGLKYCWINSHLYTNILFKNYVIDIEEAFIYKDSIGKKCFSEVSSSSLRISSTNRCFRKYNPFLDFTYEVKIDNF